MGTENVLEMKRERAGILDELRAVDAAARADKRDLTEDEQKKYTEGRASIDRIDADIARDVDLNGLDLGSIDEELRASEELRRVAEELGPVDKRFANFGEQLIAVMNRTTKGEMDSRLDPKVNRAILGMGETIPSDGGFLVQKDFSAELFRIVSEGGSVVSRVRRLPIGPNANGLKMNAIDETSRVNGSRWGGVQAFWQDEGSTKTASKPKIRQMEWTLKKMIALMYSTDELLMDAVALSTVASAAFQEEMGFTLEQAIISGSGAGDPLGILNAPALVTQAKEGGQDAKTVVTENIINMRARLWARSRQNSVWYINQDIEPQLHTMSLDVGTGGIPVYMPAGGLASQPFDTLFGRPVIAIEHCSTLGTVGDIILADMSQYGLIEKGGVQAASSIHVQFLTDQTTFRFVMRTDGQPMWSSALTPNKGTNTQSPFVTLATRG